MQSPVFYSSFGMVIETMVNLRSGYFKADLLLARIHALRLQMATSSHGHPVTITLPFDQAPLGPCRRAINFVTLLELQFNGEY